MTKNTIIWQHLGRAGFGGVWQYQEALLKEVVDEKIATRDHPTESQGHAGYLLFVEHDPVYTLGKSGKAEHLLINEATCHSLGVEYYKINRGGDITYHGPGQLVGYPILDLEFFFTDIGRYLRSLEEVIIRTLANYGLAGERSPGETGVWLEPDDPHNARKICAIGVRCSRWVTMHGFAFNVNTDLSYFDHIVPCGIQDKKVTSLAAETGRNIPMNEVTELVMRNFEEVFDVELHGAEEVLGATKNLSE